MVKKKKDKWNDLDFEVPDNETAKKISNLISITFLALILSLLFGCGISIAISAVVVWAINQLGIYELAFTWENVLAIGFLFWAISYLLHGMSIKARD